MPAYFIGIDIGTQGARVILVDKSGNVAGSSEESFPLNASSREEQSPSVWWEACIHSVQHLVRLVTDKIDLSAVRALAVTSTSGTVIPLDAAHTPLHNALMYSDKRSSEEAALCKTIASRFHPEGYTGFNTSSGLSKMVWFTRRFPDKAARLAKWAHAADYISGKFSGKWGITDLTNALKSGYDVKNGQWPAYIYEQFPIAKKWLPEVLPSGTPIGTIDPVLAKSLGLPSAIQVVAGMTDGCASQIASGAVNLGNWNTTIGTTLVIKGVTRKELKDPEDRLYSHRHPDGYWMPGGASNTGADWVREFGKKEDLEALSRQAEKLMPGANIAYPLRQQGERFPFIAPEARGFEPEGLSAAARFTANMEGVAYVERYAFELIETLSGEKVNAVYTAGGGSSNDTWLKIRSNVLNLPVYRMKQVSGAMGAAILAASRTQFASLAEAAQAMTQISRKIDPTPGLAQAYDNYYRKFITIMQEKGYELA